jgi:hypothetical protein
MEPRLLRALIPPTALRGLEDVKNGLSRGGS